MTTMIEMIKNLRQETNAGILDCRQALEQSNASYATALSILREKAIQKTNEQSQRESSQGVIELYSHGNGRIGVMVEVNCETDFTALTTIFRDLAHEIALQIAAAAPRWVKETDITQEILQQETEKAAGKARAEGKPESLIPRITSGYLKKFMDQNVLLRQVSIRNESLTIQQMIAQVSASVNENISVRRFERWELVNNQDND